MINVPAQNPKDFDKCKSCGDLTHGGDFCCTTCENKGFGGSQPNGSEPLLKKREELSEEQLELIGCLSMEFHKFFRVADGRTQEDSDNVYNVWKAIDNCPDKVWKEAVRTFFEQVWEASRNDVVSAIKRIKDFIEFNKFCEDCTKTEFYGKHTEHNFFIRVDKLLREFVEVFGDV